MQITVELVEFHRSDCMLCVCAVCCVLGAATLHRGTYRTVLVMHAWHQNAEQRRFIDEVLQTIVPCKNLAATYTSYINNCDQPWQLHHQQSWSFALETHAEATW
jgi:hypothetical protein